MRRLTISLASLSALLIITLVAYVAFFAFDSDGPSPFRHVSHSMDSTLLPGELFSTKSPGDAAGSTRLARGTVVTHKWPEDRTKQFIKRIVGLPGDTLSMVSGALFLNGRRVNEPYAWHAEPAIDPAPDDFKWQRRYLAANVDSASYEPSRNNWGPIVVPANQYFLLGDNRDNSLDSRWWGFVPRGDITGVVHRVFRSDDSLGRLRWWRLGHLVR